jgi:hypothetical protein
MIQRRELVELLACWSPHELTIWGKYISRRHVPAALQSLLNFLLHQLSGIPYWERGLPSELFSAANCH